VKGQHAVAQLHVVQTETSTLEQGVIDGYRVTFEHGPTSWGAYSDDVPGCFAVAKTRKGVERRMREAIAFHLAPGDGDHPSS